MSFEIHSQVEMVIKEEKVECHYRDKRREVETYRDKGRKNEKDDAGDDATRKDSRFTKKKKRKKRKNTLQNANSIERKRRSRTTHGRLLMHTCLL